ncbi:MAG: HD domain-containing protein, partial [Bdellovibrionota bacterium]
DKAKIFYDNGDPSHDFVHILRVVENCRRLGHAVQANLKILLPAAILHDVVNLPKNHPERLQASQMAAEKSRQVLAEVGYSEFEIDKIAEIITEHSYSLGCKPTSIESAVLQDADKLDALGAIGVMRTVSSGCRLGASYYDPAEPIAHERCLNDKAYTIDHFFTKLYKLPDLMNTEAAKIEAKERVYFMRSFLNQLTKEVFLSSEKPALSSDTDS